jgi:hypothetical protein
MNQAELLFLIGCALVWNIKGNFIRRNKNNKTFFMDRPNGSGGVDEIIGSEYHNAAAGDDHFKLTTMRC